MAETTLITAEANRADKKPTFEQQIKRNLHPDFKSVESSRPPFDVNRDFHYTKNPSPPWKLGLGANKVAAAASDIPHREIDPYGEGRAPGDNYKLLISGVIPRPIGFISTINTATSPPTANLAPFSYTNMVNHDPPIFCVGFSGGRGNPKDTCRNVLETGECVINIISEWFVEAANYTSVNAPAGVSEWELSGLTPAPSRLVKPARVKESAFAIEAKLVAHHEWSSPGSGMTTGVTCLFQGVNFWVREDVVNEEGNMIDPAKLKPVSRLGGIAYGRTTDGFELPRPDWEKDTKPELDKLHTVKKEEERVNGNEVIVS
ncbi:hypothetical protein L211DRAFT_807140 [Terfezia boudieri ATCC MYA-4762]|uniref:Flavin reductase like domain-containing protein n=1 Tax=Terfezia boudieri ATCC MYA-4762 TaxID=1051890 RepID=A0A3N4LQA7_9PEZI|nr:hypothetical protein L211DRAFT_807140 [Terfezia boudieri ATCC MYA-4762]